MSEKDELKPEASGVDDEVVCVTKAEEDPYLEVDELLEMRTLESACTDTLTGKATVEKGAFPEPKYVFIMNRGEVACTFAETAHRDNLKVIFPRPLHVNPNTGDFTHPQKEMDLSWDKSGLVLPDDVIFDLYTLYQDYKNLNRYKLRTEHKDMENLLSFCREKNINPATVLIYTGWGYNSEDPDFVKIAQARGFRTVGPSSENLEFLGNKNNSNEIAVASGLEIPPTSGKIRPLADETGNKSITYTDAEKLKDFWLEQGGEEASFIFKFALGGGGNGIKVIKNPTLATFMDEAQEFAKKFAEFSVDAYKSDTRHIEFQFAVDADGNILFGAPRDCTPQRANQKYIEETAVLDPKQETAVLDPKQEKVIRQKIVRFLKTLAGAVGHTYLGVGTVEFLYDTNPKKFLFLEVNPRLQVEHLVSAYTDGIDYMQTQIDLMRGKKLKTQQEIDQARYGHTMQLRVNLESTLDPATSVDYSARKGCEIVAAPIPTTKLSKLSLPPTPGVRYLYDCRAGVGSNCGGEMFDSLFLKILIQAKNRTQAIRVANRTIRKIGIDGPGVYTNLDLINLSLNHPDFDGESEAETVSEFGEGSNPRRAAREALRTLQIAAGIDFLKTVLAVERSNPESLWPLSSLLVKIKDLSGVQYMFVSENLGQLGTPKFMQSVRPGRELVSGILRPQESGGANDKNLYSIDAVIHPQAFYTLCVLLMQAGLNHQKAIEDFFGTEKTAKRMNNPYTKPDQCIDEKFIYHFLTQNRNDFMRVIREIVSRSTPPQNGNTPPPNSNGDKFITGADDYLDPDCFGECPDIYLSEEDVVDPDLTPNE